jgi:AcrR family transcriptional regulator
VSAAAEKRNARAGASEAAPARGRGRPRSEKAEQAILDATLELVAAHGPAALTIEGVAARAGVGKTTIYRRWATKTDLIVAAVSQLAPPEDPPDTGSFVGDFGTFAQAQLARVGSSAISRAAPRVLAESVDDAELHRGFVEHVVEPIRAIILRIVERAIARGELRQDLDREALVDLIHALPVYRLLLSGGDTRAVAAVVPSALQILLEGVSSSSEAPASARRRSSGSSRATRARSG